MIGSPSSRTWLSATSLALATGVLLSGCGGQAEDSPGSSSTSTAPAASSTSKAVVDDTSLGRSMNTLMLGPMDPSAKTVDCLATAARDSDLSDEALVYITEENSSDLASLAEAMKTDVGKRQSRALLDSSLRSDLDTCIASAVKATQSPSSTSSSSSSTSSPSSSADEKKKDKKAGEKTPSPTKKKKDEEVKTTYDIDDDEQITTGVQLRDGLVAAFSSFVDDKDTKKAYKENRDCLAEAVIQAGFTQESLRYLARGPQIKTGSVADYLPVKKDRELWSTPEFTADLVACTTSGPAASSGAAPPDA